MWGHQRQGSSADIKVTFINIKTLFTIVKPKKESFNWWALKMFSEHLTYIKM